MQGSPVDDERLIDTLAVSKKTSEEIQVKVSESERTERDIDTTRNQYVPVAIRTRVLFFCITELSRVDPMYQYSLAWFMQLFSYSILNSDKADVIADRVQLLNSHFTFSLFVNVCRSLFERHKLLFSFLLCSRILMDTESIDQSEWRMLVGGGLLVIASSNENERDQVPPSNPASDWLSQRAWSEILSLSKADSFKGLEKVFAREHEWFHRLFDSTNPHRDPLPPPLDSSLSQFQRLLLLKCYRPDRLTVAIQDLIAHSLGDKFIEPQASDLSLLFKETQPWIPVIFVLSPGADPATSLFKLAEEMRFSKKFLSISLGQG